MKIKIILVLVLVPLIAGCAFRPPSETTTVIHPGDIIQPEVIINGVSKQIIMDDIIREHSLQGWQVKYRSENKLVVKKFHFPSNQEMRFDYTFEDVGPDKVRLVMMGQMVSNPDTSQERVLTVTERRMLTTFQRQLERNKLVIETKFGKKTGPN